MALGRCQQWVRPVAVWGANLLLHTNFQQLEKVAVAAVSREAIGSFGQQARQYSIDCDRTRRRSCCDSNNGCGSSRRARKNESNNDCQEPSRRKITVILGVTGQIGMAAALKAIQQGHLVFGTSRNPRGLQETERLRLVQTDDVDSYLYWSQFFSRILENGDEVTVINTIGGAHTPEGLSLRELNVVPVVAAAQGFERATQGLNVRIRWVHTSSIAASLLEDEYGEALYWTKNDFK